MGIKDNEVVDRLAKEVSIGGDLWNNNLTCKEIIVSLKINYLNIL